MKLNLREFEDYLGLHIGIKKLMKCRSIEAGARNHLFMMNPSMGTSCLLITYIPLSPVFLWVLFIHDCKGKLLFLTQSKEKKLQRPSRNAGTLYKHGPGSIPSL